MSVAPPQTLLAYADDAAAKNIEVVVNSSALRGFAHQTPAGRLPSSTGSTPPFSTAASVASAHLSSKGTSSPRAGSLASHEHSYRAPTVSHVMTSHGNLQSHSNATSLAVTPASSINRNLLSASYPQQSAASMTSATSSLTPTSPQQNLDDACYWQSKQLISGLARCEPFCERILCYTLPALSSGTDRSSESELVDLGSHIVGDLVQWLRKLPFFREVDSSVHLRIMSSKWHQLLLWSTAVNQVWGDLSSPAPRDEARILGESVYKVHEYLSRVVQRDVSVEQVVEQLGAVLQSIADMVAVLGALKITMEEHVCLKILLLGLGEGTTLSTTKIKYLYSLLTMFLLFFADHNDMTSISDRYSGALTTFLQRTCAGASAQRQDLLVEQVRKCCKSADVLLEHKVFYLPFLLHSNKVAAPLVRLNGLMHSGS